MFICLWVIIRLVYTNLFTFQTIKDMANLRHLSPSGSNQAARENDFKDEHDFKIFHQCGKSEYDMWVNLDSGEIILVPIDSSNKYNVETGLKTTARY